MIRSPESILVYVGLDRFGDGLMKLPFVRALRSTWPAARVTWLAGKGETVYAGRLSPLVFGLVDEVIQNAGIGLAAGELLRRPLPDRRFDLILDTQRRFMTSLVLKRIAHGRFVSGTAGWLLSDARPSRRSKPLSMIRPMSGSRQEQAIAGSAGPSTVSWRSAGDTGRRSFCWALTRPSGIPN